jgi:hypothetical protein
MVPTRRDWLGSWLPNSSFANKAKVQTLVIPIELSRTNILILYLLQSNHVHIIISFNVIITKVYLLSFTQYYLPSGGVLHLFNHSCLSQWIIMTLFSKGPPLPPHTHMRSQGAPIHRNVRHGWVGFFARGWDLRLLLPVNGACAKKLVKSEPSLIVGWAPSKATPIPRLTP